MFGDLTQPSRRVWMVIGASIAIIALTLTLALVSSARAADAPEWAITSYSSPTNLPPEGAGELTVTAVNVGGAATDGSTIAIEDTLPPGLVATAVSGHDVYAAGAISLAGFLPPAAELTCTTPPSLLCTRSAIVQPGDQLIMTIKVNVEAGAPGSVVNRASVSGGGAPSGAEAGSTSAVSGEKAGPGLAPGSVLAAFSSHQAGGHANITTGFAMNTVAPRVTAGDPRDVSFTLPPGAVGNTVGMPRCSAARVLARNCPADTIVGVATTLFQVLIYFDTELSPIFDIAPSPGEPAAFMFLAGTNPVRLDTSVLSNGNYAVRVTAGNIAETESVFSSYTTIWGVPAEHEGPGQIEINGDINAGIVAVGASTNATSHVALLSNPTQCSSPLTARVEVDAWRDPGVFQATEAPMGTMSGCKQLSLKAGLSMLPDTLAAGAPAGYTLDLSVPQTNEPGILATPHVSKVVTKLPLGTVISPSSAQGLAACSNEQFFGDERGAQTPAKPARCPNNSQVGTVQIATPALPLPLTGDVYLASPECDPCSPQDAQDGKMVRLFVQVLGEGESGIVVKLEGKASIDQNTGQITATFENNPQLPFSDFKLVLGGGARATLANPRTCGPVTTNMDLTPWSTPLTPDFTPSYEFAINQGCFGPQFAPSFRAGTTNIQAGAYSPFTLSFGRTDQDEFLGGVQLKMPRGLLGNLSSVALCGEPQAAEGTCAAGTLIGHVQVLTGPGANPFLVTGGQVFITGPYKGAPYGLSIVVPAVAGPYTLSGTTGKGTVVVRAAINVDPGDAHLTVTSDPLPTMLDGIPLQLKAVNVTVDRPGFTFNPTNCNKLASSGTLSSAEGASAGVASSFQVTNCAALPFKPTLTASTEGSTSRAGGASLSVKLAFPAGPQGSEANIAKVKVDLPKQLPSRLTTLQKACLAATFEANPADCPAASIVGHAKAITPVLPVPLEGPAYFVSHGGEAFPSLVVVLQGNGVTVDLVGSTFINKQGITSSTFKQVPDVPVASFELTLPEGRYSALAANGSLCAAKLAMPTAFVAQNGAEIHQSTPIAVEGCSTALSISSHSIKKKTLALEVHAPGAGKLKISGKGLATKAKSSMGSETLTIKVSQKRAGKLKTNVTVTFTPTTGKDRKKQTKSLVVTFKKPGKHS